MGTGSGGCNFDLTLSQPLELTDVLDLVEQCFARFSSRGTVRVGIFRDGHEKHSVSWPSQ